MRVQPLIVSLAICPPTLAGTLAIDLSNYQLSGTHSLPAAAAEASAITHNWDSSTLFVLGDEGDAIVEVTTTGQIVSQMTLTGFEDTEGLTYIGKNRFVIVEERLQDVYLLTYSAGGSVDRSSLATVSLGPTVGNIGIEGISFDPLTGEYVAVKEKTPQAVLDVNLEWSVPSGSAAVCLCPISTSLISRMFRR